LHHCVNFHVRKWSSYNVQPGQFIALVISPGIEFTIALLTSLRLGLVICFLPKGSPFLGNNQIAKLLSEVKPSLIVTEKGCGFNVKEATDLWVDPKGMDEEDHPPLSYRYNASTVLQITLALYRQEPRVLVPLDAHTMYLHALRDALISLNLKEHSSWSSPLSCPIREEPCSSITTFLAGAKRVFVSDEVLKDNPPILKDEKINIIALSEALQQLWTRVPGAPTRALKVCYKNPLDGSYQAWKTFVQSNKLEKVPSFQALTDNSKGGIELFSRPQPDSFEFFLKPNLGVSWSLDEADGSGTPSKNSYGVFTSHLSCLENSQQKNSLTLSYVNQSLILAGAVNSSKGGVTFPTNELEKTVNGLFFVEVCMLHSIPKAGQLANNNFILLVFVNPTMKSISTEDKKSWDLEIRKQIIDHLGSGFLPDQVEYYPLLPKMRPLGVDRNWCIQHYHEGLFTQKMQLSQYQILHHLKKLSIGSKKISEAIA
jgi:hypothetical protein